MKRYWECRDGFYLVAPSQFLSCKFPPPRPLGMGASWGWIEKRTNNQPHGAEAPRGKIPCGPFGHQWGRAPETRKEGNGGGRAWQWERQQRKYNTENGSHKIGFVRSDKQLRRFSEKKNAERGFLWVTTKMTFLSELWCMWSFANVAIFVETSEVVQTGGRKREECQCGVKEVPYRFWVGFRAEGKVRLRVGIGLDLRLTGEWGQNEV